MAKLPAAEALKREHKARKPKVRRSLHKPTLSPYHSDVVSAWFANGCVSKRRAIIAAGGSEKTATGNPHSIFNREDVMAEIERRRNIRRSKAEITEARIIEEYSKLALANVGDLLEVAEDGSAYMDFTQMTDEHRAALTEFQFETYEEKQVEPGEDGPQITMRPVKKYRAKFASKQAALDSLARIKGMFKDKLVVESTLGLQERIQAARERIHADSKKGFEHG